MAMLILAVGFCAIALISLKRIRNTSENIDFIYHWGFPIGAFVWEDLFVFSLLGSIVSCSVWIFQDYRIGYLSFSIFWLVRSAGETLYFFLEQFTKEKVHPHILTHHFQILRRWFGNISDQKCFILLQVFFQSILVISIVTTILILLHWNTLA